MSDIRHLRVVDNPQPKPKRSYHLGEAEIETPRYFCKTCNKRNGNNCACFQRPIEPDFNRCFNHSNYKPILAVFQVRSDLEELIQEEQEKLSA